MKEAIKGKDMTEQTPALFVSPPSSQANDTYDLIELGDACPNNVRKSIERLEMVAETTAKSSPRKGKSSPKPSTSKVRTAGLSLTYHTKSPRILQKTPTQEEQRSSPSKPVTQSLQAIKPGKIQTRRELKRSTEMGEKLSSEKEKIEYPGYRVTEARDCAMRIGKQLEKAKNVSYVIKNEIERLTQRLVLLVTEEKNVKGKFNTKTTESPCDGQTQTDVSRPPMEETDRQPENTDMDCSSKRLSKQLEEQAKLIKENNEKMERLRETIERQQEVQERLSYASVAAAMPRRPQIEQTALHSVVISAKDESESGEEIFQRIRSAVNAKEGGVTVEKIRKARDRKIIVGCRTEEERDKVKERLKRTQEYLIVQEVKN